jgi:hypothetical protein
MATCVLRHDQRPPTGWCQVCWCEPARPGRRDRRCPTCAAYWHRYHRDRTEELIIKNNRRAHERTILRALLW